MPYLDREQSFDALRNMQTFHTECNELFLKHGFDFVRNLGRRNIVMSQAQEKFFAQVLAAKYSGVSSDGRTGEPDITIGELSKELECKLTTRGASGSIDFNTDYKTLAKKGSIDYLYVIADPEFAEFAVLFFEGLTVDDFRVPSNGSRGKAQMYKHKGMKKCQVLVGKAINNREKYLRSIREALADPGTPSSKRAVLKKRRDYWKKTPASFTYTLEKIDAN